MYLKKTTITAVREIGSSRHHRGPIEGLPKTPRTITAMYRVERALIGTPLCLGKQVHGQWMYDFSRLELVYAWVGQPIYLWLLRYILHIYISCISDMYLYLIICIVCIEYIYLIIYIYIKYIFVFDYIYVYMKRIFIFDYIFISYICNVFDFIYVCIYIYRL